ncbi:MAG: hypothetical protein JW983_09300, partial [Elusimicrobia bacterium]|nr:hypothetical protein [Elusimicrobiota bacterium]
RKSFESKPSRTVSVVPKLQEKQAIVTVDAGKNLGKINRLIYGTLMCCYTTHPSAKNHEDFIMGAQYGFGMWDPDTHESVKETIELGKEAGITILRLMGMWEYWKDGVDIPGKKRTHDFGVDERMQYCSELGAEVMLCFQHVLTNPRDLNNFKDLLCYLNIKADKDLIAELKKSGIPQGPDSRMTLYKKYCKLGNDDINWANLRALNGHIEPYNVKYVEIGNETYIHSSAKRYANIYLDYYKTAKSVDPDINVGVVCGITSWNWPWEVIVSGIIKAQVDFLVVHLYPGAPDSLHPDKMFRITSAIPETESKMYLNDVKELYEKSAGKKIPITINEYNGWFLLETTQRRYMHTMGVAVAVSELLKTFINMGDNILSANHFNFTNEAFGMVSNVFWTDWSMLHNPYFRRPDYYVIKMYSKHFGGILTGSEVKSEGFSLLAEGVENLGGFRLLPGKITGEDLLQGMDMDGTVNQGNGIYRLDILGPNDKTVMYNLKSLKVNPDSYYKFSFDIKIDSIDNNGYDECETLIGVKDVRGQYAKVWEARSPVLRGESDPKWVSVEKTFKTPSYTSEIMLLFQRWSGKPLKQKIYLKNIKLYKFEPDPMYVDYVSAIASKSTDGKKAYVMLNNRNMTEDIYTKVLIKGFNPKSAIVRTLSASDCTDRNEGPTHDDVKVTEKEIPVKDNTLDINLKKCSVTAIELY